ncbi:MAG TPA: cupin-like domain-containing protein [Paucimonas sp.]|nr:cupin-like domain-containing protein [Paucimonas sp.]
MKIAELQPIPEWRGVDGETFRREIATQYRPAVLKGLVRTWPAVRRALESPESICEYLMAFDNGKAVDAIMTPPEENGRIFYRPDLRGFNYLRNKLSITAVIRQLARYSQFPDHPALAIQSAPVAECLPGFSAENGLTILGAEIPPRIWIGNAITTPAHFDESNNIACVASGRRRFILFPPEQAANLYIGPLDHAPTRTPISMVSFKDPDFTRFPKFREALAAAQCAELEPGDAIYIPSLWWHHVESIGELNILVNYWWKAANGAQAAESPFDCLLRCARSLQGLPAEQRLAWGALFNHALFAPDVDPGAHLSVQRRGVLGGAETSEGDGRSDER